MPTKFGDPSYPGLGTAGVQSQGYVEKWGFRDAKPHFHLSTLISVQIANPGYNDPNQIAMKNH